MSSIFYIPRRLLSVDSVYSEEELLAASNYVVVLAEPGGGKTELMRSLAEQLGVSAISANLFSHMGVDSEFCPLVIDAFDELAKIDSAGVYRLLSNAKKSKPTHVIISSRSSEWGGAATNAFKEFIGFSPLVVRLYDFDECEQRLIFNNYLEGEDFSFFQAEVSRFDLEGLLPNPQFLKLFADAFIQSERSFADKKSIFSQAVERLAREVNVNFSKTNPATSTKRKIELSSEIFAKLLLSGCEGIGTNEANEDRMFPLLASLFAEHPITDEVLQSRLFKLGDRADQHRPVHKIVAEYCAADYLVKRIANPADPLTLSKCLPIIAPNSTVRDELRGLLGWMASLGSKSVQVSAIELDPYAVLSNGDPSQLEKSSKKLIVKRLQEISNIDPDFRRGDFWRRFSVAGFFTPDVIDEIKPILESAKEGHLRDLMLELLVGSPAIHHLTEELRRIVLNPDENEHARLLASSCLLDSEEYEHEKDLGALLSESSLSSLRVAAKIFVSLKPNSFELSCIVSFLRACANLYPSHKELHQRTIGARYFIERFVEELDLSVVENLLDELVRDLSCQCGKKNYECECCTGVSKVVGALLDRYFELSSSPFEPVKIWQWLKDLKFHAEKKSNQSKSVEVLQRNNALREGILAHVFGGLKDRESIFDTRINKFDINSHSGLHLNEGDVKFIVDLAFEMDNPILWASFIATHQIYRRETASYTDSLRRHMREQASKKILFMREWVKFNRSVALSRHESRFTMLKHSRKRRRYSRQRDLVRAANITFIQGNRELIEGGKNWACLVHFAEMTLMSPKEIKQQVGDETLVRNALRNCFDILAPQIPDLLTLAELQCASQYLHSEMVLFAACLEVMRTYGTLESVDVRLLTALRTHFDMGYSAISKEEKVALKSEIDRLVFSEPKSAEIFLRQYVEPQLACPNCPHPEVELLNDIEVFGHLRGSLSIEWLERFDNLALGGLDSLFDVAAQSGSYEDLRRIVASRCKFYTQGYSSSSEGDDGEQRRTFWLVRSFYFMEDVPDVCWNWLKADRRTIVSLYERSGRLSFRGRSNWPALELNKVVAILNIYIDKWPRVELPSNWGADSPIEESAYRFLCEMIWSLSAFDSEYLIPTLDQLLVDARFSEFHRDLKSIRVGQVKKQALRDFEPPTPLEIVDRLDRDAVVTVEGLRELLIQELTNFQKSIDGGEFNSASRFYEKGERLGEVKSTEIIAERMSIILEPQGIVVTSEHQLKSANRCDFTATKIIGGLRRLLVVEVKGQWHKELYTAASAQLNERYAIHPAAEHQGVFLVIWFGANEKVAGLVKHGIKTPQDLKVSIEKTLPVELVGRIDVFVLDVSRD